MFHASLARARARSSRRSTAFDGSTLRALRDEAAGAHEDDLPALLHELEVRQRLAARPLAVLPDPASPYVAHLRVDEGKGPEDYLLGHVSFFDPATGVCIVDWRVAPVARIFYRYREGDPYEEEFPGRIAEGRVLARRIVAIEGGRLTRIVYGPSVLERGPDGEWRDGSAVAFSPGGAGTAAREGVLGVGAGAPGRARPIDVTALLDTEQYAAVMAPDERPLLVLGSAGSGKTTVALHRMARIAASDTAAWPLARSRVVVPEEGLARLSRRLLAPFGIDAARVQTTGAWLTELAGNAFGRGLHVCFDAPPLVVSLKRHPAAFRHMADRIGPGPSLKPLRRRLHDALSDRSFLRGIVDDSAGALPQTAIDETLRHTALQTAPPISRRLRDLAEHDRGRAVDGLELDEGTPDEVAGTIDLEDLPFLLWWFDGFGATRISLLVLDEAEDFSLSELALLRRLLAERSSVTLAGDESQQTDSSFAGWEAALEALGAEDIATCRLPTSYRCPRPVAELARRILGPLAPEAPVGTAREGAPVGVFRMPGESQAELFLAGAVVDLMEREPGASVGVVAASPGSARHFFDLVSEHPEARLVLRGDFTFEPGIDVTDVDNAKGLEFDYVIIPDASASAYPATQEARRRLHVAATRASHQLWIVAGGAASPILASEA